MGDKIIKRICLDAMMCALFIALGTLRIRIGGFLEIGLGTLVITFVAITYRPIDAILVALIGESINQIFLSPYGLSPTTPLWVMPVVIRGLLIALIALYYRKKEDYITNHPVKYFLYLMGIALIISGLDTGLLYLDGLIMNYPVSYTFIQTITRFGASQVTAIIVAALTIPLYKAASKIIRE